MSDNQQRGPRTAPENERDQERKPDQPPQSQPKSEERPSKKSGTPIDIGPGPGSDVVSIPQRRFG